MPEIRLKGGFTVAKSVDTMIGDLVGTLTDPIIVYPGGWGDSLPEWLKNAIVLERLTENMKASKGSLQGRMLKPALISIRRH